MMTCRLHFDTIMFKADTMSCAKLCQERPPKISDHHFPNTSHVVITHWLSFLIRVRSLAQTLILFQLFWQKNNVFVTKYLKIQQQQEILVPCLVLILTLSNDMKYHCLNLCYNIPEFQWRYSWWFSQANISFQWFTWLPRKPEPPAVIARGHLSSPAVMTTRVNTCP